MGRLKSTTPHIPLPNPTVETCNNLSNEFPNRANKHMVYIILQFDMDQCVGHEMTELSKLIIETELYMIYVHHLCA